MVNAKKRTRKLLANAPNHRRMCCGRSSEPREEDSERCVLSSFPKEPIQDNAHGQGEGEED